MEKIKCNAIVSSGSRCLRNSKKGMDFCWQHSDQFIPVIKKKIYVTHLITKNSNVKAIQVKKDEWLMCKSKIGKLIKYVY